MPIHIVFKDIEWGLLYWVVIACTLEISLNWADWCIAIFLNSWYARFLVKEPIFFLIFYFRYNIMSSKTFILAIIYIIIIKFLCYSRWWHNYEFLSSFEVMTTLKSLRLEHFCTKFSSLWWKLFWNCNKFGPNQITILWRDWCPLN